ncbi:MAG: hypothetical protein ACYSTY_01565 [Planctomycetota bacterium]|jgi:hypothetical protein
MTALAVTSRDSSGSRGSDRFIAKLEAKLNHRLRANPVDRSAKKKNKNEGDPISSPDYLPGRPAAETLQ